MGIEVFGVDEVLAVLTAMAEAATTANRRIVKRGQAVLNDAAKREFTQSHKRGTRTPSTPGEPPAVVTGSLRRSITSSPIESTAIQASGSVYPSVVYARIQELGGTAGRGSRLPARPYMAPAGEASTEKLRAIAVEEWATAMRL